MKYNHESEFTIHSEKTLKKLESFRDFSEHASTIFILPI